MASPRAVGFIYLVWVLYTRSSTAEQFTAYFESSTLIRPPPGTALPLSQPRPCSLEFYTTSFFSVQYIYRFSRADRYNASEGDLAARRLSMVSAISQDAIAARDESGIPWTSPCAEFIGFGQNGDSDLCSPDSQTNGIVSVP